MTRPEETALSLWPAWSYCLCPLRSDWCGRPWMSGPRLATQDDAARARADELQDPSLAFVALNFDDRRAEVGHSFAKRTGSERM